MAAFQNQWLEDAVIDLDDDGKSSATAYLQRLTTLVDKETCRKLFHSTTHTAQVTVLEDHRRRDSPCTTNRLAVEYIGEPKAGLIFVSAISAGLIGLLGAHFSIDPLFFVHHAYRPPSNASENENLLNALKGLLECKTCWHIESGPSDLVLIDGDAGFSLPRLHQSQDVDDPYSQHASEWSRDTHVDIDPFLHDYFSKLPNRRLLHLITQSLQGKGKEPAGIRHGRRAVVGSLCGLLGIAALRTMLDIVAAKVEHVGTCAINEPSTKVLAYLRACRGTLHEITALIVHRRTTVFIPARKWAKYSYQQIEEGGHYHMRTFYTNPWPKQYQTIEAQARSLVEPLNDNFQLLIGAITVLDSDVSKKQAKRSTMLTLLAAIYLPLSLATGIFGMNIREINGERPRWWAVVIVVVILVIPSAFFIVLLFTKEHYENKVPNLWRQHGQQKGEKMV